jgi:hypothetical protein
MKGKFVLLSVAAGLSFGMRGQSADISVLRTVGTDVLEPAYVVLKDYGNGYASCNYFDGGSQPVFAGEWRREGDSLLLRTEYGFCDGILLPARSFDPEQYVLSREFVYRDKGFEDCTRYPEEHVVIEGDTVWSGTVRPGSFHATYYEERYYIRESLKFAGKRSL